MNQKQDFYEELADFYHLMFENWDESIRYQSEILSRLLPSTRLGPILDCTCGIGTQSIALAQIGYQVDGSDLSKAEINRAKKEALSRGLNIRFRTDDMRILHLSPLSHYEAVIAMDNSLPHLDDDDDILKALIAMYNRLKSKGILLLSVRDYEKILIEHTQIIDPVFFMDGQYRRIVHQVWDWLDDRRYVLHLYITYESPNGWRSHHFTGQYRAIKPKEIVNLMNVAGFKETKILSAKETGFYQPIIYGKKE